MRRSLPIAVLVLAGLARADAFAQGCAMCGTTVGGAHDPLARGIFFSMVFMLTSASLLVLSIGGWLFIVYRRASRTAPSIGPSGGQGGDPDVSDWRV